MISDVVFNLLSEISSVLFRVFDIYYINYIGNEIFRINNHGFILPLIRRSFFID